jgi:MFS transporter, DHA1 family, inner membrane transport protein
VFTYITPILENVTHLSPRDVTGMLLLFGAGLTVGNLIGGRLADWKLMPSVIGTLLFLIPVLGVFTFTSWALLPAAMTLFAWGVLAFALVSPLQTRVVNEAAGAPNFASTLNQGAFNFGNAIGAWAGGIGLTLGMSFDALPLMGVALSVTALFLTVISYGIDKLAPSTSVEGRLAG